MIGGLDQVLQLGRRPSHGPPRIVALPEWCRARVVLRPVDGDPLAVDADDAGDDGQVDPIHFHPRPLLDVQLNESSHRMKVLLSLAHPIERTPSSSANPTISTQPATGSHSASVRSTSSAATAP